MVTAGIFTIIGIAIAVGAKVNNNLQITDIWTEYVGDGTQGIISKIIDYAKNKIIDSKTNKKLSEKIEKCFTESGFTESRYRKILVEIKTFEECQDNLTNRSFFDWIKNKLETVKDHILRKRNDLRFITDLSNSILWNLDYKEYLQNSETFKSELEEKQQDAFVELIKMVVEIYQKHIVAKTDREDQVMASVVVGSLKSFIKDKNDDLYDRIIKLFTYVMGHDGQANLQQIALAKYTPKYILNECPRCGYDGDRIYTDEKTNTTHCAACGASYSVVEYCYPELIEEINNKIKRLADGNDKLGAEIISQVEHFDSTISDFEALLNDINSNVEDSNEKLKILTDGLLEVVTKEYLDKCFNKQEDNFAKLKAHDDEMKNLFETSFANFINQIVEFKKEQKGTNAGILEIIQQVNNENRKYNSYFAQKLDSLGGQISSLYNYARDQFGDLGAKTDIILQYVERLCAKEFLEDMSNTLGADLKKTVAFESQIGYEQVAALTTTSMAQIMASIDSLKNDGVDNKNVEKIIRDENIQLSGQINSLSSLIENSTFENRTQLKTIIEMQEETKAILMATVGLKVDQENFKKMYRGRIPSKYLYNDGLGGEFACPYCGAIEDRRINNDDYCRCSVCGQAFLGIDPFPRTEVLEGSESIWDKLKNECGRGEDDPLLATKAKIEQWRKAHTAILDVDGLTLKTDSIRDKIVILPEDLDLMENTLTWKIDDYVRYVETLIFPRWVERIDGLDFSGNASYSYYELKNIVFECDKYGKYYLQFTNYILPVRRGIKVYGKYSNGRKINFKEV